MPTGNILKSPLKKLEKDSPSVELKTKLNASLVVAKDLSQQPASDYILLTGAGRPIYYAVDGWDVNDEVISFFRFGPDHKTKGEMVYTCRREGTWALVARDAVNVVTDAEFARHQMKEGKEVETFMSELDPKGWAEAQAIMAAGGIEAVMEGHHHHGAPSVDDSKPTPGQYL